jgi:membrane-bound lytic murein transglycosylase D
MVRFLLSALFAVMLLAVPVIGGAVEELYERPNKAETSKVYERAVEFFTKKIPETFRERLANSQSYIGMIKAIFTQKGVPSELAYLPLIESGFSPLSVGPGDAVGLWQFMRGTARQYGLRIDDYVDERKDPLKSTFAAADYLRYLYSLFGAWDVALAAYNAGEGRIKGISNIYNSKSTPAITRRYVPHFMAAFTVATNARLYGFDHDEEEIGITETYREILSPKAVSLKMLARTHGTTVQEIVRLNPALLTDTTPPYPYRIRLPL